MMADHNVSSQERQNRQSSMDAHESLLNARERILTDKYMFLLT